MRIKSNIQLLVEEMCAKNEFFSNLSTLLEEYEINHNIFCAGKNMVPVEPSSGFFDPINEYNSLVEAKENFNVYTMAIYIREGKFITGNVVSNINHTKSERVIDLSQSKLI